MLVEVVRDMYSFGIILIWGLVGFSIIFHVNSTEQRTDPWMFTELKSIYRIAYGDFDPDGYTTTEWLMFLLASIIMPLILLNLLISIISDTYGRVQENSVASDYLEKTVITHIN